MKKKGIIILSSVGILLITGYLYLRYSVLNSKTIPVDQSKASSPLDLRPALIAKLQQLVLDGSGGLYKLSIEKLDPDIVNATVDIVNAVLTPDSAVLAKLD